MSTPVTLAELEQFAWIDDQLDEHRIGNPPNSPVSLPASGALAVKSKASSDDLEFGSDARSNAGATASAFGDVKFFLQAPPATKRVRLVDYSDSEDEDDDDNNNNHDGGDDLERVGGDDESNDKATITNVVKKNPDESKTKPQSIFGGPST